jgi:hypothetical protein
MLRSKICCLGRLDWFLLDWPSAHWASVVLLQPRGNTLAVEEVTARQNRGLLSNRHIIDADDASGLALTTAHLLVKLLDLEFIDSTL